LRVIDPGSDRLIDLEQDIGVARLVERAPASLVAAAELELDFGERRALGSGRVEQPGTKCRDAGGRPQVVGECY
jgi:hypothetical protein